MKWNGDKFNFSEIFHYQVENRKYTFRCLQIKYFGNRPKMIVMWLTKISFVFPKTICVNFAKAFGESPFSLTYKKNFHILEKFFYEKRLFLPNSGRISSNVGKWVFLTITGNFVYKIVGKLKVVFTVQNEHHWNLLCTNGITLINFSRLYLAGS